MKRYDDELEFDDTFRKKKKGNNGNYLIAIAVLAVIVIALAVVLFSLIGDSNKKNAAVSDSIGTEAATENQDGENGTDSMAEKGGMAENDAADAVDTQDPQSGQNLPPSADGADVNVTELLSAATVRENSNVTVGIDVAKYQGTIDWEKVAASGIDFAMIRVGYRTMETGEICADSNAKYNMQEAQANGIKVGVYFFSTAISKEEAETEADWVADYISQYQITYPVAYNCEGFENPENRQYVLTKTERSDIAMAFLDCIYEKGYTPMFYAAKNELTGDAKWETSRLETSYKIWVSQYPEIPAEASDYSGVHAMWQYTNQGSVEGIDGPVDVNLAYFGYEGTEEAKNSDAPETVAADAEALMTFTEVNETVTAKSSTNLRDIPSQGEDSTVMMTLQNGDTATRTGTSSSGWSRVVYNGQTYYAVSSYLTTDLSAPAQKTSSSGADSGDGLKTKFTDCEELVTAKIEVNLRALPSVTNPDATVIAVLHNGEVVTRTGINTEYGWSRVDYNGQTLYCVSSMLTAAQ